MYICACAIFFPHPLLILGIHCGYGVTTSRCLKYVHKLFNAYCGGSCAYFANLLEAKVSFVIFKFSYARSFVRTMWLEFFVTLLAILDKLRNSNHVINEWNTTDRGDTGQPLRSLGMSYQINCGCWIKSR